MVFWGKGDGGAGIAQVLCQSPGHGGKLEGEWLWIIRKRDIVSYTLINHNIVFM